MTTYSELRLRIDRGVSRGSYRIVATGPAGEALGRFKMPVSELELENFILRVGRTRRGRRRVDSPEMELAKNFGTKLFGALFEGDVRELYRSSYSETRGAGRGLRVTLSLTGAPELLQVPWEYLYDHPSFLSISTWTPIVRYLDLPKPRRPLQIELPLRILAMVSAPNDAEVIDAAQERSKLEAALAPLIGAGAIAIDWLEEASLRALQRKLRKADYHVFHFIGHGGYDQDADDGVLLFEDEQGRGRRVSGVQLGTILADEVSLRLAVLNSCEGGRSSLQDPFSGVATSLIEREIPAVIGMQFEITDRAAIVFAGEFYAALADGLAVDSSVAEARKAIYADENDIEWGTPVLFMRVADGRLFDVQAHAPIRAPSSEPEAASPDEVRAAEEVEREAEAARREAAEAAERERVEAAAAEAERAEAERAETERAEAERAETERAEADRAEAERAEAERAEAERAEKERAEAERAGKERAEAERAAAAIVAQRAAAEAAAKLAEDERAKRDADAAAEADRVAAAIVAERAAAEVAAMLAEDERAQRDADAAAERERVAAAEAEEAAAAERIAAEAAEQERQKREAEAAAERERAAAAEGERIEREQREAEEAARLAAATAQPWVSEDELVTPATVDSGARSEPPTGQGAVASVAAASPIVTPGLPGTATNAPKALEPLWNAPPGLARAAGRAGLAGVLTAILADAIYMFDGHSFDSIDDTFIKYAAVMATAMAIVVTLVEARWSQLRVPGGSAYGPASGNRLVTAAIQGALTGGTVGFVVLNIVFPDNEYWNWGNVIRFAVYGTVSFVIAEAVIDWVARRRADDSAPA